MIMFTRIGLESSSLPPNLFSDQALSPELGFANSVDKAVACSDYQEPDRSDEQEPKTRTIGNQKRPQTRRNAGLQHPLTMLTTILVGLLLTLGTAARGSSALWGAPSPRASALGRCKLCSCLLEIRQ